MAKSIQDVVEKEYPHFAESVQSLTIEQLEDRLIKNSKEREQVIRAKQKDTENTEESTGLGFLKNKVAIAEGPYKDALKALNIYDRYIVKLIEDKGGNVEVESSTEDEE